MNNSIRSCLLALALLIIAIAPTLGADSPRTVVDLNLGWKFLREDAPGAEQNQFDDSSWQSINLPHTWNNLDGQDGGNNYHRGVGFYRRHLPADPAWAGKEIFIKFDAASIDADVFVNGKPAGTHSGPFSAFCFDITSLLNLTGDNVIAVKVNNAKDPAVAPLEGDFDVCGGIYRSVHLLVLNPLCISPIDDASSGVYVRQDHVDADNAKLTVKIALHNRGPSPSLKFELLDAVGQIVASRNQSFPRLPLAPGDTVPFEMPMELAHPHLWNGRKDPYLYTMRVTVLDAQTVTDVVEQPVGLRFFRVDPNQGFFLNGEHLALHGVNRHQDHLDEGWAITLADHQNDFSLMMEMGCTAVRLSHYQHAQEFYDLCDHGGIVAWAEIPLVNRVGLTPAFDANAQQQLRELIKQSFNHPAICFWSLSNELRPGKADQMQHQVDLITKLNSLAHELDSTRLSTQASWIPAGQKIDSITDVIGFNRYYGWYDGSFTQWPDQLDKIHAVYPNRSVAISEYGAGSSIFQHEAAVKQPMPTTSKWHPEEWECLVHEHAWEAMSTRPWIWGEFIWCLHDFAADQRNEGDHAGRNDKGMVTYDGKTRKDVFYFYKANWSSEPVIHINDSRFSPRPIADEPVKIYSNCDNVELKLNGQSLGTVPGNDIHVFIWPKAQMVPGENKLEATGTRDGKIYTDICTVVFDVNAKDGHVPTTKPK